MLTFGIDIDKVEFFPLSILYLCRFTYLSISFLRTLILAVILVIHTWVALLMLTTLFYSVPVVQLHNYKICLIYVLLTQTNLI